MSYEPLHHKYRPQTFADLVGQEAIATTLTNAIRQERIAPAYLFTGPRGTGKTSSARILAKSLNCLSINKPTDQPCGVCAVCQGITKGSTLDVIEIDAASNTGVDNIRELIEKAQFAPVQCRYKVYVIDECHMLSTAAFNALLKTLEEPPDRVVFVLATTDPQRVLPTIISRCQRFDFRRIPLEAMATHLRKIASLESINIAQEAVQLVAQVSQGGLRDAESLLDQLSLLPGQVTVERVWDLVGSVAEPDLMELLKAIARKNAEAVIDRTRTILDRGREPLTVLQNLASFYRDLLIAKAAPRRNDLVGVTPPTWKILCEEAILWDTATILQGQKHLKDSEVQIKNSTQPRLWLEVTLLGLLPAEDSGPQPASQKRAEQVASHNQQRPPSATPNSTNVSNGTNGQRTTDNGHGVNETQRQLPSPEQVVPNSPPHPHHERPDSSRESVPSIEPISTSQLEVSSAQLSESVWLQMLANLEPVSTRAMLNQMGHLIAFDGTTARIGFKSLVWYKNAQALLPKLTAAFQDTFKCEVQVNLELVKPPRTKNPPSNEPPPTTDDAPTLASQRTADLQADVAPFLSPDTDNKATESLPTTDPPVESPLTEPPLDKPPAEGQQLPAADLTPSDSPATAEAEEDEAMLAAQLLASAFKGEVITFNLDSPIPQPQDEKTLISPLATPTDWANEDEDEDEIDF